MIELMQDRINASINNNNNNNSNNMIRLKYWLSMAFVCILSWIGFNM